MRPAASFRNRVRPSAAAAETIRKLGGGLFLLAIALVPATVKAQTTVSVSPTSVITNGVVTATWSGIPAPSTSDSLGLFNPGTPSTALYRYSWASTNGAASGSIQFPLPGAAHEGTYELRLLSGGGVLAISNAFTVVAPPSVSGIASLNGVALTGVVYTATNGVTCTTSTTGQYSCTVPVGWSGSVTPSRGGVSFTPSSRDYSNVTVSQTAQDYPATSTTTLSESPASAFVGSTVTATWSGTPGPADGNWLGLFHPGDPSMTFYLYGSASVSGQTSGSLSFPVSAGVPPGTYELRLFSSNGNALLATSNSFTVVPLPSVSGTASLNGVALTGVVYTATNGVTCTTNTTGQYSCTVPVGWSGSVTPSRGGVSFTPASRDYTNVTVSQTAQDYPATSTTTLSESPASAFVGSTVTATWSGTPGPADFNWLGLFNPGAPSMTFYLYSSVSVSGQTSGTIQFPMPAAAHEGTYELRLFSSNGNALLATSNTFTLSLPVSVSGTVTAGGSPLSGVAIAATNGGTCTASDASGQYSCTVPQGWSGSVTPTLSGYNFTPASRSYTALQANQTGQDFVGSAVGAMAIYYIVPDQLNTPRLIQNQAGNAVWRNDNTEPFGDSVPNENPSGLGTFEFPLRFPGQYKDRETGLAYNANRDYDVGIGRYIESDPIGVSGGLNTYAYVDGSPLDHVDILGLVKWTGSLRVLDASFGPKIPKTPIRIPLIGRNEITLDLESECVHGKKVLAVVRSVDPEEDKPWRHLPFALYFAKVEVEDASSTPNAHLLEGAFGMTFHGLVGGSGTVSTGFASGTFSGWGAVVGHYRLHGKSSLVLPPKEVNCVCSPKE